MAGHFHHPNELDAPPESARDKDAVEVLRGWIVGGGLSVSLHPMAFGGPATWGILLVDVARHVARACEDQGHGTYAGNLAEIRELLEAEFAKPTDLGTTERLMML
jgi:hypothetical protein